MSINIGVLAELRQDGNCFDFVNQFRLNVCQLVGWDLSLATNSIAEKVKKEAERKEVRISAMWAGFPGPAEWNFIDGPNTLGLVPKVYRTMRIDAMKKWAEFASWIGAPAIITHCGFIPENMTDPEYPGVVKAIQEVAVYCKSLGIEFWFETGQETPVVLLRTIEHVGTDNVGINLDPANLILYGKGNPVDAIDVIGPYIRNVHVKDGFYPTTGNHLGKEAAVGQGLVNFPILLSKLRSIGFTGELIIEREAVSGEEQKNDILRTIQDLQKWMEE